MILSHQHNAVDLLHYPSRGLGLGVRRFFGALRTRRFLGILRTRRLLGFVFSSASLSLSLLLLFWAVVVLGGVNLGGLVVLGEGGCGVVGGSGRFFNTTVTWAGTI